MTSPASSRQLAIGAWASGLGLALAFAWRWAAKDVEEATRAQAISSDAIARAVNRRAGITGTPRAIPSAHLKIPRNPGCNHGKLHPRQALARAAEQPAEGEETLRP